VDVTSIVTVVDAERIMASLETSATARLQVRAADLVLLNKCDLVDLADISRAEDAIAAHTQARVLRCRHSVVPLAAVLDVEAEQASSTAGVGVVSHEAATNIALRMRPATLSSRLRCEPFRLQPVQQHVQEVDGISTAIVASNTHPVCAGALTQLLIQHVLPATSLLRMKGHLWLAQRSRERHVVQLSGNKRLSVIQPCSSAWEGPPETRLVLIGTKHDELAALRALLESLLRSNAQPAVGGAGALAKELAADTRLQVTAEDKTDGAVVRVSVRGLPRYGVDGNALNETLMHRVNASRETVLLGVAGRQPPGLVALHCVASAGVGPAILRHADEMLRVALAHVRVCDC
jgi:G3E family GTPase